MKFIFSKILHGFLFGIGLSVALGVAYYYMTLQMMERMQEVYSPTTDFVEITKHRELERDEKLVFLGEVKNNGEEDVNSISLNVDLYKDGEFVKQCTDHISKLVAGKTRNFEMTCGGGCSKNPIVEHDSYKISIVCGF